MFQLLFTDRAQLKAQLGGLLSCCWSLATIASPDLPCSGSWLDPRAVASVVVVVGERAATDTVVQAGLESGLNGRGEGSWVSASPDWHVPAWTATRTSPL